MRKEKKYQDCQMKIKLLITDFDGVMTDNKVLVDQYGKEAVYCNRLDGLGIELLNSIGIQTIVVSREENPVVEQRCKKLKIGCFTGVKNKESLITHLLKELSYKWQEIAYIGDSVSDYECLKKAGYAIIPKGCSIIGLDESFKRTSAKGGEGIILEVYNIIKCHNQI